jgi:hypothetical protein
MKQLWKDKPSATVCLCRVGDLTDMTAPLWFAIGFPIESSRAEGYRLQRVQTRTL